MTKPNIGIFDCQTQEEIIREMTDEEYAQYEIDRAAEEARLAAEAVE
jgi:hypothetical protein